VGYKVTVLSERTLSRQLTSQSNATALRYDADETTAIGERTPVLLLVALYVLTVLPRLLVFPVSQIDWDEYYSALLAQGLLHGQMPNNYVFSHHPAALYYFYAPFLAAFGSNVFAIRAIALTFVSVGFYLVYRICTSAGVEAKLSAACAGLYGVITLFPQGLASNTELIVNAPLLGLVLACLNYSRRPTRRGAIVLGAISGLCVSVSYMTVPIVFSLVLGVIVLVQWQLRPAITDTGVAAASALCIFWVLLLPIFLFGDIVDYFTEQIDFLRAYASLTVQPPSDLELAFSQKRFIPAIIIPALPAVAILWFERAKAVLPVRRKMILIYLSCYFFSAVFSAVAPQRYYPHYALLVAPAIVLMTAFSLNLVKRGHALRYALVLVAACAVSQPAQSTEVFIAGARAWKRLLNYQPPDALAEVVEAVKRYAGKGDYIFVSGLTHTLYVLSETKPPTRLAFGDDLWISDPKLTRILGTTPEQELTKILALHPRVVVVGPRTHIRLYSFWSVLEHEYDRVETIYGVKLYRIKR
jgi:4-amino-4-deoxy-L-arabinose transferase-like glycosyltransferase